MISSVEKEGATMKTVDYGRLDYEYRQHHVRFRHYVESRPRKLTCQECGGAGGYTEPILDDGSGPYFDCDWCEGTGFVMPFLRGLWLRSRKL